MDETLKKVGGQILGELKGLLKSSYGSFTDAEKRLVEECALDAARVAVRAAAGEDVSLDKAHIDAQIANFKSVAASTVSNFLWAAATKVFQVGLSLLLK